MFEYTLVCRTEKCFCLKIPSLQKTVMQASPVAYRVIRTLGAMAFSDIFCPFVTSRLLDTL